VAEVTASAAQDRLGHLPALGGHVADLRAEHSRVTYGTLKLNNLNNGAPKCDS